MRVLVFEWRALGQDDLEEALEEYGIELCRFMYQFHGLFDDPYFIRHFGKVMRSSHCDAVISWNFWPLVADVCFELNIPYIAWVYDCPVDFDISQKIQYPTSYLFLFDKEQYAMYAGGGATHAFHLPLAVNTNRIDKIHVSKDETREFGCDVSFLGTMYEMDFPKIASCFTEYERGYISGLIDAQQKVYGGIVIDKSTIPEAMTDVIRSRWIKEGILSDGEDGDFHEWLIDRVLREVTRRDRVTMISVMGDSFDTKYYSDREHPLITNAKYCGYLDYYSGMYKMFRSSRINLNITSRLITKGISLRALDILAAGGFLLSNWQEELVENFRPDVDFVCYESIEDAREKAQYYLEHEEERRQIAENGHNAVRKFDYRIQLHKILSTVFPGWKSEAPVQIGEI